jgi:hypothetical protein
LVLSTLYISTGEAFSNRRRNIFSRSPWPFGWGNLSGFNPRTLERRDVVSLYPDSTSFSSYLAKYSSTAQCHISFLPAVVMRQSSKIILGGTA